MNRTSITLIASILALSLFAAPVSAQYAVGHRSFGGGTSFGAGYSKMDYQFPTIEPNKPFYLLPTLEFKVFFSDALSLDLSVPVVNIAASNALQKYFFFTAEAYLDFHPSAPSSLELFVAPGLGVTYAKWSPEDQDKNLYSKQSGYAFHVPVRIGFELNNASRSFSFFVAARPFFSLVHGGSGDNRAGGGGIVELGLMAYSVGYRADRY
jgi:hypothetical protein